MALPLYCRKIIINKKEALQFNGPLLIAANHPNSFLDAIILGTIFRRPIYSLARGDVFAGNFYNKLLRALKMLPVYRKTEGIKNLENNYSTFDECIHIFKNKGIVLIFSEGECINEWHLRPLKKGTARLAINTWQQKIPLQVLPLGINYSSFRLFGKNVILNFGEIITSADIDLLQFSGRAILDFNCRLKEQLAKLVIEVNNVDKEEIKSNFYIVQSSLKKISLAVPAAIGWLFHFPLYLTIDRLIKHRAQDHYDSIMIALLFLLYPFYIILISVLFVAFTKNNVGCLGLIFLPVTAWCCLQLKRQIS